MPTMPSVDWFSQAVFAWVSRNSTVFLPQAMALYQSLSVLYIAFYGAVFTFDALAGMRASAAKSGIRVLITLVLVGFGLHYYSAPASALGGLSVHQVLPKFGEYLANILNTSSLNACTTQLDKLIGAQHPPTWHSPWIQIACYSVLSGLVWLLEGLMFMLTIVGFAFMGVGIVFGPLLLVCTLIPIGWVEALTPAWFRYMLNWSMFQVVAAALISVWSAMVLFVLNAMFHGVYTGIELVFAVKLLIIMTIAFMYLAKRAERIAESLFGGTHGAQGFADYLQGRFL